MTERVAYFLWISWSEKDVDVSSSYTMLHAEIWNSVESANFCQNALEKTHQHITIQRQIKTASISLKVNGSLTLKLLDKRVSRAPQEPFPALSVTLPASHSRGRSANPPSAALQHSPFCLLFTANYSSRTELKEETLASLPSSHSANSAVSLYQPEEVNYVLPTDVMTNAPRKNKTKLHFTWQIAFNTNLMYLHI